MFLLGVIGSLGVLVLAIYGVLFVRFAKRRGRSWGMHAFCAGAALWWGMRAQRRILLTGVVVYVVTWVAFNVWPPTQTPSFADALRMLTGFLMLNASIYMVGRGLFAASRTAWAVMRDDRARPWTDPGRGRA